MIATRTPYLAPPTAFPQVPAADVAGEALAWRSWPDDEGLRSSPTAHICLIADSHVISKGIGGRQRAPAAAAAGALWGRAVRTGQKPPVSFSRSAASASSDASVPSTGGASEL